VLKTTPFARFLKRGADGDCILNQHADEEGLFRNRTSGFHPKELWYIRHPESLERLPLSQREVMVLKDTFGLQGRSVT
jgi:hypothetical protein